MRRTFKVLFAKLVLKIIGPPKPEPIDPYKKRPEESELEYRNRVPLAFRYPKENPTIDYLGKPLKK